MKKQRSLIKKIGNEIHKSDKFKLIKYNGSFYCDPIESESDYKTLFDEVNLLKSIAKKSGVVVLKVKGLIKLNPLMKSYSPEYLSSKVVSTSTKSKKLKEQRIENCGTIKAKDQFRYITLLSMDWADTNVFPIASRYETSDNLLEHYDRSHLMEFIHKNLIRSQYITITNSNLSDENITEMATIDENEISSKDALEIIKDIEDKYPLASSNTSEFHEIKKRLEKSDVEEKFTISKLLGKDGINFLLNEASHNFVIVIGQSDIVVNELKNINNKFNQWQNINYEFADLIDKLQISLTEYVRKNLMGGEWDTILKPLDKLIGKAEEYRILPTLAVSLFKKSNFTKNNVSDRENFESLCLFLEGKSKIKKSSKYGVSIISSSVTNNTKLKNTIIKHLYSSEVFDVLKELQTKIKSLKEFADKNKYDVSKITELVHPIFGIALYPLYAAILVNDDKMFNKWDDTECTYNAKRLIQTFVDVFFGDDIFKIDKKSKKVTIYPNSGFAEMILLKNDTTHSLDQLGSKSHLGRAHHFTDINLIDKFVKKFSEITGNQGSNFTATKNEIETFQQKYFIESLYWFEMDSRGKAQRVGWGIDGYPLNQTSLEHLDNTSHHQLVLRYLNNNLKDGASDKTIKLESDWYEWLAKLQEEKFFNLYPNDLKLNTTVDSLKYIASQKKNIGK